MRGIVRVEERNGQIVTVDDFDRSDDERVLRGEEFMTALIARGDFVEHTMADEAAQDLPQRGDRGERFGPVAARVDDLQALAASPYGDHPSKGGPGGLYAYRKEPFALPR